MVKSRKVAALLAFLGGTFGLHKFYLNDPGSGIFYLILSAITFNVFPLVIILGILDALKLMSTSDQKFDIKYNKEKYAREKFERESRSPSTNRTQKGRTMDMQRGQYKNRKATSKRRPNPFINSGNQKFKEYDLEGALVDYGKAMEISPADKDLHFNLACIHSLKEDKNKSLYHLEEAISLGYKNVERIKTIDELAYLRIQPEFESFVNNGYVRVKTANQAIDPPKGDLLQEDKLLAQLNKLKELRTKGLLSDKEFTYEKEKLTNRR